MLLLLLVDTGAQHSDVFASSTAGQKLAPSSVGNKEPMYTQGRRIIPLTALCASIPSV